MRTDRCSSGLTIVETALAIGLAAFSLLVVLALLPMGVASVRDSVEERGALGLAGSLMEDLRGLSDGAVSPRFGIQLPAEGAAPATKVLFLTEGGEVTANPAQARYRFALTIQSRPAGSKKARPVHFRATWPAEADPSQTGNVVETITAVP
jgi:uncharacterized protein (TIGR02598 family)